MYQYGVGASSFGFLLGLVFLADMILVGVWLWKHITK